MKEAKYYQQTENNRIDCNLCPHRCNIAPRKRGLCGVRKNKDGRLYTENYGKVSALGLDPIEKKPLYHFYPQRQILSVGTFGCNFTCDYCQNWEISQEKPPLKELSPEQLVETALKRDSFGIAYTYSEPSIWYEYMLDSCRLAADKDLSNVVVTNGYLNEKPLKELIPYLDAANVDLKAFDNEFYKKLCSGSLEPVLRNIKLLAESDVHLELTTLIITDYNDSKEELEKLFSWVHDINPEIPIHLSRYFPRHKLDKPPTSIEKMEEAYRLASKYLNYVYMGNVDNPEGGITYCPECNSEVILRKYYKVTNMLDDSRCPICKHQIHGKFKS